MPEPSTRLRGRVAVITGSTRGIGLHIATAFAQAGAQIVISGRKMDAIEEVYTRFTQIPGVEILGWPADVSDYAQVATLAEQTVARFGRIDIWVNNAGISAPYGPSFAVPPDRWRQVIDVNLVGAFNGTHVALAHMLPQNSGKIINILGFGATESKQMPTFLSAYAASKAGVLRMTQVIAAEYRHTKLSILPFLPGLVATELTEHAEVLTEEARASVARLPWAIKTFGVSIDEVAEKAVYLASSATDGVTGKLYQVMPGRLQILWRMLRNGRPD